MRYYTYKVTFPTLPGYYYIGYHKDDGKPYYGSPVTNSIVWEFHEPHVEILEWFDTREEAVSAEYDLLECWTDPHCLNENRGKHVSTEVCRENGRRTGPKNGKRNGPQNLPSLNSHPNTKKARSKNGRETKNLDPFRVENGNSSKTRKVGIHSLTLEQLREQGRKGGRITGAENFSKVSKETLSNNGKENVAKLNSQKWVSTMDGYVGSAGNVARHNKKNGWDPKARVKVDN
jgi:hypothetical protein